MSTPPPDDFELGPTTRGFRAGQRLFDRFVLGRILGRGGMGVVWLAQDEKLRRPVALKFLPEQFTQDALALDDLRTETSRALELTHPHIVRTYDLVEDPALGIAAISMEYVDGDNLSNLRVERPHRWFEPEEIREWVRQLCEALAYAHSRPRVVHRDLKPANLMITAAGEMKVADFGVARSLVDSASRVSAGANSSGGTLVYMSPQQALGGRAAVADDIYALGATLYDLLTGRPPFYSGNIYEQLKNLVPPTVAERRLDLRDVDAPIPAGWESTIAACLEKDPAKRPQSAAEVWERLNATAAVALQTDDASTESTESTETTEPTETVEEVWTPAVKETPVATESAPRKPLLIAAAAILLAVLAGVGIWAAILMMNGSASSLAAATKEKPFINSLGMKFVPVPITGGPTDGKRVLFGVWDVRVQDYAAYAAENSLVVEEWKDAKHRGEKQGPTHPVVRVSWGDAKAFCAWLTKKERAAGKLGANEEYRLPSDHEWSCAVGIGDREDASKTPGDKDGKIADVYPWGSAWPPPAGAGNYLGEGEGLSDAEKGLSEAEKEQKITGYKDGYKFKSPVGSFAANQNGMYDMGGNVWQWCEDKYYSNDTEANAVRVVRGGSWNDGGRDLLLSSCRYNNSPSVRSTRFGFRVVVSGASGGR